MGDVRRVPLIRDMTLSAGAHSVMPTGGMRELRGFRNRRELTSIPAASWRAAYGDVGYLTEHGGPTVLLLAGAAGNAYSPMVYAPQNEAQACLSLPPFSGNPDQIACTGYH
jgi:hypothetical protein